jgi:hypothetical protein
MRTSIVVTIVALALAFAACSGDAPPSSGKCTGAAYEPCNEEHDCDSMICMNFAGDGFQVCTQTCDAATPCPDDAECNDMGICKPAAPNECEL